MIEYSAEYLCKYTNSLCMHTFYVGQGIRNTKIEKLKEHSSEKEWWYTQLLPTLVPEGLIVEKKGVNE